MCFKCGRVFSIDALVRGSAQSGSKRAVPIWICPACRLSLSEGKSVFVAVEGKRVRVKLDGSGA